MSNIALVVPSIREESFDRFVDEWDATGLFDRVDLILMEDNPSRTFELNLEGNHMHLCWEDIDRKSWSHIIPRRSDTVRSFGYWWAYSAGYKYLMTMDDDCYPEPGYEDLDVQHLKMLDRTRWFNTLNNVRPRGTPYKNLGKRPVYINHGLWTHVLDYDAPQQLVDPVPEVFTHDNRIVPQGAYFSFCGMNAIWRREAMVLSYHLLMGKRADRPWDQPIKGDDELVQLPFDRFGDIWCGIISKKICDHLGWSVSSGTPYIHHDRASDPFTNLKKEAPGIGVNETFWERIDSIELTARTPEECYIEVARGIAKWVDKDYQEYWKRLSNSMEIWATLFMEK